MKEASPVKKEAEHSTSSQKKAASFLDGGGEMGRRIRAFDWLSTPLGAPENWPHALKTSVSICLNSRFAMLIWWGKDLIKIYNDPYAAIISQKHPHALGAPGAAVWPEIWNVIGPMLEGVMENGEATWSENLLLELERNGFREECYFTFSYSPIRYESGGIAGVFTPVEETTRQVIGTRRLGTLGKLAEAIHSGPSSTEAVCEMAGAVLQSNPYDIPFAAIYLFTRAGELQIHGAAGFSRCSLFPAVFPTTARAGDAPWFVEQSGRSQRPVIVPLPHSAKDIPLGAWGAPASEMAVLPIAPGGENAGFLLVGVSPRRRMDDDYLSFLSLLASNIATGISNARAFEQVRQRAEALAELGQLRREAANQEAELRSEAKLAREHAENILATITDGFFTLDQDWQFAYANPAAERLLGTPGEKLIGKNHWEVFPQILGTSSEEHFRRVVQDQTPQQFELYCPPWKRWFSVRAYPDEHGGVSAFFRDITVRRQDAETRNRLAAIVESSDDAIISKDLQGIIRSWNRGAERIFGYRAEEMIGQPILKLAPPDAVNEIPKILERVKRGELIESYETRRRTKDGKVLNMSLTISPVRDSAGTIIGASKVARDVTRQKRAEALLLESQGRLRAIYDGTVEYIGLLAPDGTLLEANRASLEFANSQREDVVGRPFWEGPWFAFTEGAPELVQAAVMRAAAGESLRFELELRRSSSETVTFEFSLHPIRNENGQVVLIVPEGQNITDRKRAVQALRESEELFRQAIDSMPQLVWSARPDGFHDLFNKQWFEYTGLSAADIQGTERGDGWSSVCHPDDEAAVFTLWQQSLRSGEPFEIEFRCRRHDGQYLWFLGRATPIRDEGGRIIRWFGTCTDVDARKRVEEDLRRANEDLEQFAYSVSHDLQEPLRAITIYSELLVRHYANLLDSQGKEFIGYLRNGAVRMEALIRDLLAYTQLSSTTDPAAGRTDVNAVVALVTANLATAITESGAEISWQALPSIPVRATHVHQLLQNLVGNAIKYRGDRKPRVEIAAQRRPNQWLFSVADNGIGIDPEYRERIFGLFKRLHNGDKYAGTGIGLAICQRIVERYGGRIWVEPRPEEGSIFYFTLPAESPLQTLSPVSGGG